MKVMQPRVGPLLTSALLCSLPFLALAGSSLAASESLFALVGGTPETLTPASLAAAQKTETKSRVSTDGKTRAFGGKGVVR